MYPEIPNRPEDPSFEETYPPPADACADTAPEGLVLAFDSYSDDDLPAGPEEGVVNRWIEASDDYGQDEPPAGSEDRFEISQKETYTDVTEGQALEPAPGDMPPPEPPTGDNVMSNPGKERDDAEASGSVSASELTAAPSLALEPCGDDTATNESAAHERPEDSSRAAVIPEVAPVSDVQRAEAPGESGIRCTTGIDLSMLAPAWI